MKRPLRLICTTLALMQMMPVHAAADAALDAFARDVDRTQSVRAVKHLQSSYAQYAQYGLWQEVGALFSSDGSFVFDGSVKPAETAKGAAAIASFLRQRYGGGKEGMTADGLSAMMIDSPVVNLTAQGDAATARWQALIFHGHGGAARIEGGIFVNDYVREDGVWKIRVAHYHPQFDGPYEEGWTNWGGGDLPVIPKHFDTDTAGVPIPPPVGTAPRPRVTLAELQRQVDVMNEQDRILNLQSA